MNTAMELMMHLSQIKLELCKLTNKHRGISGGFDTGVMRALSGLNRAIVEAPEVVRDPNVPRGSSRRRPESKQRAAQRHANWLQKQTRRKLKPTATQAQALSRTPDTPSQPELRHLVGLQVEKGPRRQRASARNVGDGTRYESTLRRKGSRCQGRKGIS